MRKEIAESDRIILKIETDNDLLDCINEGLIVMKPHPQFKIKVPRPLGNHIVLIDMRKNACVLMEKLKLP